MSYFHRKRFYIPRRLKRFRRTDRIIVHLGARRVCVDQVVESLQARGPAGRVSGSLTVWVARFRRANRVHRYNTDYARRLFERAGVTLN